MKPLTLATFGVALAVLSSLASAATVSFSSGGNFTSFRAVDGGPLQAGYLHAGFYVGDPLGLNSQDLRDTFEPWATLASDSGAGGFFGITDFPVTPVSGAAGQQIYLVVTDTQNVANANEIAVFTNNTDPDWEFPATDLGFNPTVSMDDIVNSAPGSSVLEGTQVDNSGFPAIQLVTVVPEPSTALLALLGFAGLLRRRR